MSYADLASQCGPWPARPRGSVLTIDGLTRDEIAYNPSRPFSLYAPRLGHDVTVMYVRVESRDSAAVSRLLTPPAVYDPRSVLYREVEPQRWAPAVPDELGLPADGFVLDGVEDPFVCTVGDELVVGGVVIDFSTAQPLAEPIPVGHPSRFDYSLATTTVTVQLWRGATVSDLTPFALIKGMREVRLVELADGSVFVATRPHGGAAGLGTIGFTWVASLEALTQEAVDAAHLMPQAISAEVKTGPNDLVALRGTKHRSQQVGVLAHAAFRDARTELHYLAMTFRVRNPRTVVEQGPRISPVRVIACRNHWPATSVKRPTLEDVVFPSAISLRDGEAVLLGGLSDAAVGQLVVPDPFGR